MLQLKLSISYLMQKNILVSINFALLALVSCLTLLGLGFIFLSPNEIEVVDTATFKGSMPKNAFALSKISYDAIAEPFLTLKYHPLTSRLPDLKKTLIFYGKNGRPDAMLTKPHLHFSFTGSKTITAGFLEERLYLHYNKEAAQPHYAFSKDNETTSIWIETDILDEDAIVKVFMENEYGEIVQEPASLARFNLKPVTQTKFGSTGDPQELGGFRIDGSLLARQKAKWYGFDRFLEKHGGEEFLVCTGKHRVDFGDAGSRYSVFVAPGDCLIHDDNRWKVVQPGTESLSNHLLVVKKIDERIMNFELWDVEGKNKIVLNVIKAHESNKNQIFDNTFKFVGARTRSQFVFEIDDERVLLRPKDWLVLTDDGWKKLTTAEEIDDYVEHKLAGPLFVFDGIVKKEDGQVFYGTMFNTARTEMQTIELPIAQNGTAEKSIENHQLKTEKNSENPVAKTYYKNLSSEDR